MMDASGTRTTNRRRLLLSLYVVAVFGCSLVTSLNDMFTAIVDVQRALDDELAAANLLRNYIRQERERIDQLERVADGWENHSKSVTNDIEGHVYHPVNYYLLAKYFSINWQRTVETFVTAAPTNEFLSNLKDATPNYPDQNAFEMSAGALMRLQDVYSLPTEKVSGGQIGTRNSSPQLSADDCLQLGKVAYEHADFYHALMWLTEALRIDATETTKTASRACILDYLSYSTYKQGNLQHAFNLTLEWLQLDPTHERAHTNLRYYKALLNEEAEQLRRDRQVSVTDGRVNNPRILNSYRSHAEFENYEKLCRGEHADALIEIKRRDDDLTCQFRRHVPFLYIRPLKEEIVNINPKVVIFHDVLADSEIDAIHQLAIPKLHRSGVFALESSGDAKTPGYTDYRTSKSAWLNDSEHPLLRRASRKAQALSNLTLFSAEDFQVLNYGIGGHYEPHFDYARDGELSQFSEAQGNRIATTVFYMNDVEYGGRTVFNQLGIGVDTKKGSCLLWYNLLTSGEGDLRTIHAGCPVLVGTKWIANKWFHFGGQEFSRPCRAPPHVELQQI